jgi:CubicO group peptidase (beta-lactamase class C family)
MFKLLGSVIVIISICFTASGDHASQANNLDCHIHHILKTDNIPGLSAAIVVDGQVAWSKGYGYANMETRQRMTADTPFFEIASVTKVITATALMIAQEQGYLSLDDDIDGILIMAPFEVDRPQESETYQPVTFRHLASHTSGIVDSDAYACAYFVGDAFGEHQKLDQCPAESPADLEGFLASYLDKDGLFYNEEENFTEYAPGERYQYSNIATGLEGYLIGLATGVPLDEYAMWTIFKPLGMYHTSWNYSDIDPDKIAVPYWFDEEDQTLTPLPLYSSATWPDGGLKTSANDLGRLLGAMLKR